MDVFLFIADCHYQFIFLIAFVITGFTSHFFLHDKRVCCIDSFFHSLEGNNGVVYFTEQKWQFFLLFFFPANYTQKLTDFLFQPVHVCVFDLSDNNNVNKNV